MSRNKGERIFNICNYTFLLFCGIISVYPFIYVLSASISSKEAVDAAKVVFFPIDINFKAYKVILGQQDIWIAYGNTLYMTIVGTLVNLVFTTCGAYPLSKKKLVGRKIITFFVALTLWFNAGIIPFFLNLKELGLLNYRNTLIIAFAVNTFNVILLRTFFQSIPESLEEAAKIDGYSNFRILTRIYLPLSKAALATIGLFYAVDRWNGYFWSMIILKDDTKIPLQVFLKRLIVEMNVDEQYADIVDKSSSFSREVFIYATIMVAIIPMIIVYPYIQRYFVKGIMIGSVKG